MASQLRWTVLNLVGEQWAMPETVEGMTHTTSTYLGALGRKEKREFEGEEHDL